MIIYLVKMIACSAVLYGLYALLFRKEKMLVFNRFYLLGSLVISFLIPLISITVSVPATVQHLADNRMAILPDYEASPFVYTTVNSSSISFTQGLFLLCIMVSSVLLIRLLINLYRLRQARRNGEAVCHEHFNLVLVDQEIMPYTFMNTVYLNKSEFNNGSIEAEVLEHELAHIRQRHSLDILFIELLQVVTWFNPMLYLFRRAVRTNHELLADAEVVSGNGNVAGYQHILLQRAAKLSDLGLVSSFNYLTIKKRLVMLQQKQNVKRSFIKALAVLPVLGLLVLLFHERVLATEEPNPLLQENKMAVSPGTGILEDYENLLDKYGLKGFNPPQDFMAKRDKVTDEDYEKMSNLFNQLTFDEQNLNSVRFVKRLPPVNKVTVKENDLRKWQGNTSYGVWVDGKRIPNQKLSNYAPGDFSHVFVSRLTEIARKNDGFSYQIDLMTNKYYTDYYKAKMKELARHKYLMVFGRRFSRPGNVPDPGISDAEMKEYLELLNQYSVSENGVRYLNNIIPASRNRQLTMLYVRMNMEQRKSVLAPPPFLKEKSNVPPTVGQARQLQSGVAGKSDTLPPPPPPPPFSWETQQKFSEWPVIVENITTGEDKPQVFQLKGQRLPAEAQNLVIKLRDNKPVQALIIYKGYKVKVVDISSPEKQRAFEKNYGVKLPPPPPPVPPLPPSPPVVPSAPLAPPPPPPPPHNG